MTQDGPKGFERTDFDLGNFLRTHIRYAWLFMLSIPLFLSIAWFYNWYSTPYYSVSTKLMISDQGADPDNYLKELQLDPKNKVMENEIEVLRSHSLLNEVISRLEFDVSYFLVGNYKTSEVYKSCPFKIQTDSLDYSAFFNVYHVTIDNLQGGRFHHKQGEEEIEIPFEFNNAFKTPVGSINIEKRPVFDEQLFADESYEKRFFKVKFNTISQSKNAYLSKLRVKLARPGSTILELSLEDEVPLKAMDFLNTLVEVYLDNDVNRKNTAAQSTSKFITDQLTVISSELNEIELNKQNYKVSKGILDLDAESRLLMENALVIDKEIHEIESQINMIDYLLKYVTSSNQFSELAPSALDLRDPLLASLIGKLNDLEGQRKEVVFSSKEGSPNLAPVDAQIDRTKSAIVENARNIKHNIEEQLNSSIKQRASLNSKIGSIPGRERELVNIERQFRIKENLYTYLLEKQAEVSISLASSVVQNRVVDKARTIPGPVRPIPSRAYSIALLLGIFLPLLYIIIRERLKNTVSNRKMIENLCSVPIIGVLGQIQGNTGLVIKDKPRSALAESFRAVRTNLKYFTGETPQKVILVTSSVGSEGKTFTAMNLAGALAIAGSKTVLLGMDLRKPKLNKDILIDQSKGLSSYLISHHQLEDVIQQSVEIKGLDVIPSGPVPPNPSELIMTSKMNELFGILRTRYDHIIIDSPPIGLVTDGYLLAKHADASVYIVRQHVTKKAHVRLLGEIHKQNKLPNLSILFNAVKKDHESGYGGYGYGYGYGYFEEEGSTARQILNKTKELLSEN